MPKYKPKGVNLFDPESPHAAINHFLQKKQGLTISKKSIKLDRDLVQAEDNDNPRFTKKNYTISYDSDTCQHVTKMSGNRSRNNSRLGGKYQTAQPQKNDIISPHSDFDEIASQNNVQPPPKYRLPPTTKQLSLHHKLKVKLNNKNQTAVSKASPYVQSPINSSLNGQNFKPRGSYD